MIRSGEVRVNKGRARPDRRLGTGDQVRIPPVRLGAAANKSAASARSAQWLEERILYEDRNLLVLDKPSGLAVHGGSGIDFGAIELLRSLRGKHEQLELVHRLDRDTSGCLLVAKKRSALRLLHEQFRQGEVQKIYIALLHGSWKGGNLYADEPLLTTRRRNGERHVTVSAEGKPSRSKFMPEQVLIASGCEFQLTRIEIETGRTHQIRVHAAHIGHPVAGDSRYGMQSDAAVMKFGLNRLFLHASTLVFESPQNDRVIRVEAPLSPELAEVLGRLKAGEK